jgi:TP901 family phage tail tape measure protein
MTTKTVAVQLVALTGQYQKAMAGATASTAKLQTTSAAAGKSIGSVMGPQIAIGAAVAAGAAVKLALDWDDAFTKIGAITDTSQAQVNQWKEQVLALSGTTAQAPQELADALYFLASAGLDASQIMPTLEMSAKASAVGLGETGDIARLTANALNAYSASGLTAAQVTDTLVAAVREGTAEPDEFADAMGRILPIASKAGISFDQVAASLAGLSNIGLDVNEGVTAMRGVMVALLAPGKQAADTLAELGLSADDVRRSLAEDGLIATLRMLESATGGNIDLLRKIIPNVRAMAGAFGLTGQEAAKLEELFRAVMDSSGSLNDSFKKTEESAGHKLRQAFVDLQNAGIELGEELVPVLVSLAETASELAGAFGEVADGLERVGQWLPGWGTDLAKSVGPGRDLVGILNPALGLFRDLTGAGEDLSGSLWEGVAPGERLGRTLGGVRGAAAEAEGPVESFGGKTDKTTDSLERAEGAAAKFADKLAILASVALSAEDAAIGWNQALADMNKELRGGTKTLDITSQAGRDNRSAFLDAAEAAITHGEKVAAQTGSVQRGVGVVRDHIAQLRQQALQAGFTEREIDAYIRKLNLTPKQISTLIRANTAAAEAGLRRVKAALDNIESVKEVLIRYHTEGATGFGGQRIGHAGGVVGQLPRYHGGGQPKSDEQLVLARRGEHILTARQYDSLQAAASGGSTPVSSSLPTKVVIPIQIGSRTAETWVVDLLTRSAVRMGA